MSVLSCQNSKVRDCYAGFVVDEMGMPISGVSITRDGLIAENRDTTDLKGYFSIKRTDNFLFDLIFSKKGYQTDTVRMVWLMHGEKEMYSDLVTSDTSRWIMREVVYRDSIMNTSDKLRIYENDSIEMYRDEKLLYTQYLNRDQSEVVYRHYNYIGQPERVVYATNMEIGQLHFRDLQTSEEYESIGYLSTSDSIPSPENEDWSKYKYVSVVKSQKNGILYAEEYIAWESLEDWIVARDGEQFVSKKYNNDSNEYEIEKWTGDSIVYSSYYANGQLKTYFVNQSLYGGIFTTFYVSYDSLGHTIEKTNYEFRYPECGKSYNDTFIVATTQEYYPNGRLKFKKKIKSYAESDDYRCGVWIQYSEEGKILNTIKYGDCYNLILEDEYNDHNLSEVEAEGI